MFVTIGTVAGSFGIHGELKVAPQSNHPERLGTLPGMTVFIELEGAVRRPFKVTEARMHGALWRLKLAGVDRKEDVQALQGGAMQIPQSEVLPLPEGSFYVFQLVGLAVYTDAEEYLGDIVEVMQPGANDVYVVEKDGRQLLIPAIKEVVMAIDIVAGRMTVKPLPGLFEEDDSDA